jgi:hypothetical protein
MKKLLNLLLDILKFSVVSLLITGILNLSTVDFVSSFFDIPAENQRLLKNSLSIGYFICFFGLLVAVKYFRRKPVEK